jgi:hypothetical protein
VVVPGAERAKRAEEALAPDAVRARRARTGPPSAARRERFEEGATLRATVDDLAELERAGATVQRRVETAVLDLLADG